MNDLEDEKINDKEICRTCKKEKGEERFDNGLKCGVHCDKCWHDIVYECKKRSW